MRLAVLGFGIMGERLVRASLDHPSDDVNLAGVWDPSADAMARLARDLPDVARFESAEAAMDAADCVYIASPPATHLAHARAALALGRAVFTEKPLGVDLEDSRAFVAETKGKRAAVNFVFASSLGVAELGRWIDAGAVGRPKSLAIETDFRDWPRGWQKDAESWLAKRGQGGFTREVVSHFLFLTARKLGPMKLLEATVDYPPGDGAETAITAEILAGDTPVTLRGGVGATKKDDHNRWLLEGDAGAVRLSDWSTAERLGTDGAWRTAPDTIPHAEARPLILRGQLTKLAAMTDGKSHDLASPDEALHVQEIVEAILAAGSE